MVLKVFEPIKFGSTYTIMDPKISCVIMCLGVVNSACLGRFRILGGARFRIFFWGGGLGGANSRQAHDVVTTSMRRNDVASTSFRRRVPTRFLINQCQIITFLILKYDIIENSRIELRGIVLPVQVGGLLGGWGGAGGQKVCWPPQSGDQKSYYVLAMALRSENTRPDCRDQRGHESYI